MINDFVVIEKISGNILRARQINQEVVLPAIFWENAKKFFKRHPSIKRILTPSINGEFSEKEIICNPPRLLLISSYGILDEYVRTNLVPSYGVWKLAYYLSHSIKNLDVQVIDPNLLPISSIEKKLQQEKFNFIGFSVIPANLENDLRVISLVKKNQPQAIMIIGGIESHVLLDIDIQDIFDAFLIIGPGETALVNIIKKLNLEKSKFKSLPKVIFGKSAQKYELDENILPINKVDLIHKHSYKNSPICITITNQCRFSCFWCSSPKDGPFFKSSREVIEYIKKRRQKQLSKKIVFYDNDISYNPNFIMELCNLFIQEKILEPKHCKSSIIGMSNKLLKSLSKANFVRIAYGVESFDKNVRQIIGKDINDNLIETILNLTLEYNIIPEINLIIFSPGESLKSLKATLIEAANWLKRGALLSVTLGLYAVLGHINKRFNINYKHIFYDGMKKEVILPHIYTTSKQMSYIFKKTKQRYAATLNSKCPPHNHIKSLIKLKIISEIINLSEQKEIFDYYIAKFKDDEYISV